MSPLPVTIPRGHTEHIPRVDQFDIGQYEERADGADANRIIVLERLEHRRDSVIFGLIENLSEDVTFTFSIEESSDNAVSDAYAGVNIRVAGVSVADVAVVAGGRVEFILEGLTEKFIQLVADSQDLSRGRVTLTHFFGDLKRRERTLVP